MSSPYSPSLWKAPLKGLDKEGGWGESAENKTIER
jgi:hypothetical protein